MLSTRHGGLLANRKPQSVSCEISRSDSTAIYLLNILTTRPLQPWVMPKTQGGLPNVYYGCTITAMYVGFHQLSAVPLTTKLTRRGKANPCIYAVNLENFLNQPHHCRLFGRLAWLMMYLARHKSHTMGAVPTSFEYQQSYQSKTPYNQHPNPHACLCRQGNLPLSSLERAAVGCAKTLYRVLRPDTNVAMSQGCSMPWKMQ